MRQANWVYVLGNERHALGSDCRRLISHKMVVCLEDGTLADRMLIPCRPTIITNSSKVMLTGRKESSHSARQDGMVATEGRLLCYWQPHPSSRPAESAEGMEQSLAAAASTTFGPPARPGQPASRVPALNPRSAKADDSNKKARAGDGQSNAAKSGAQEVHDRFVVTHVPTKSSCLDCLCMNAGSICSQGR